MSSFNKLTSVQKLEIIDSLKNDGVFEIIQNAIAPLVFLYDECPLSFMGTPTNMYSEEDLVSIIKQCVIKTINRYETPAIVLYGAMLLFRLVTKTIAFSSHINMPDFNSVIHSPDSEEARRAAGALRSSALAEFGILEPSNSWAKHFWDRNYELSPCELR